jgi:hypothetical protein
MKQALETLWGEIIKTRHFQKLQSGILLSSLLLLAISSAWAQNPAPSICTPLFPERLAPGGPSFVLTLQLVRLLGLRDGLSLWKSL